MMVFPLAYLLQFFFLLYQGQLRRPMNSSVGQNESLNVKSSIFSQGSFHHGCTSFFFECFTSPLFKMLASVSEMVKVESMFYFFF